MRITPQTETTALNKLQSFAQQIINKELQDPQPKYKTTIELNAAILPRTKEEKIYFQIEYTREPQMIRIECYNEDKSYWFENYIRDISGKVIKNILQEIFQNVFYTPDQEPIIPERPPSEEATEENPEGQNILEP